MDALTHDVQVLLGLAFIAVSIAGLAIVAGAVLSRMSDDAGDG